MRTPNIGFTWRLLLIAHKNTTKLLLTLGIAILVLGCTHTQNRPYVAAEQTPTINTEAAVRPTPYRTEPWKFMDIDGVQLISEHYRIYTTINNQEVRRRFPAFMESALRQYRTTFGPLDDVPKKLIMYIMQDRRQWKNLSRQLLPQYAPLLEMIERGGFATNGIAILFFIDWGSQSKDTMTIAAHEGWHQYMQATFECPLPAWLDEGIATYLEGHRTTMGIQQFEPASNSARLDILKASMTSGQVIPLRQIMNESPQTFLQSGQKGVLLYYAQTWTLIHYLMQHPIYRKGLEQILLDAQSGVLTDRLKRRLSSMTLTTRLPRSTTLGHAMVQEYLDPAFDQFEAGYWRFTRQQANQARPVE